MQSPSYRTVLLHFNVKSENFDESVHKSEFHSYANYVKTVKDTLRMTQKVFKLGYLRGFDSQLSE